MIQIQIQIIIKNQIMQILEKTIITVGNNMEYFSISYKGDIREKNEDYYKNETFKDSQIFLIADGMGGCKYGKKLLKLLLKSF